MKINNKEIILSEDTMPEFVGQIVDIFEDFASDNHISIPNVERDEEIKEAEEEGISPEELGLAIIYGSDYDVIGNVAEELGSQYMKKLLNEAEIPSHINNCIQAFNSLIERPLDAESANDLSKKMVTTLQSWNVIRNDYILPECDMDEYQVER